MIIHRAFYREAAQATLMIVAILVVVFVFFGMTAILGRAARGEYADDIVLTLLGWMTLKRLDLLLPLAFYLGVLLTLSRWYRDSEMTVLSACGVSLLQLLRPVLGMALVVAAFVGVLAMVFTPLATGQIEKVKKLGVSRGEFSSISPGVFNESQSGQRIFYAESIDERGGTLRNVFVSGIKAEKRGVIVAERGRPYVDEETGDKFLALQHGTLYDGAPGEAEYKILEFETYHVRIEPKKPPEAPVTLTGMSTGRLLGARDRYSMAEWHWRLAKPILVFVLALFALVLAYTDVRRGRLANLFAAILVYFIYSNLLGLGQTLIKKAAFPAVLGLWWLHALALLLAIYLLRRRVNNKPLFSFGRASGSQ
jgi:lipopolysaccharide export system permease protein